MIYPQIVGAVFSRKKLGFLYYLMEFCAAIKTIQTIELGNPILVHTFALPKNNHQTPTTIWNKKLMRF